MIDMYGFILQQHITKAIVAQTIHNLEDNAYLAYSGGKDSCVASKILDLALPYNEIPRVFINTGIEYSEIVRFVRRQAEKDRRIIILNAGVNIKSMLETYGYPFKSKEHSHKMALLASGSTAPSVIDYFTKDGRFKCPLILRYQYENPPFNISDKCCYYLKKAPARRFEKASGRRIVMTGIRKAEGGQRANKSCTSFDKSGKLTRFHPCFNATDDFIEQFIKNYAVEICDLYKPPFNFKRTGCKGCPFGLELQEQLLLMQKLLPSEYKQAWYLWGKVYNEYLKLDFRIKKSELQPYLF